MGAMAESALASAAMKRRSEENRRREMRWIEAWWDKVLREAP